MIDDADALPEPAVHSAATAQAPSERSRSTVPADAADGTEASEVVGSQGGSQSTWPGLKRVQAADAVEGDKTAPAQTEAPKKRRIMPTLVSEAA